MNKILLGALLIASVLLTGCFEGDGSCGGGSSKPNQQEVT
tara:strand:- start:41 stop:160 length:120 start_codon:yes stop_codon:yes gene_type:complete